MKKILCDKCGGEIKLYTTKLYRLEINQVLDDMFSYDPKLGVGTTYELCSSCLKELEKFLGVQSKQEGMKRRRN